MRYMVFVKMAEDVGAPPAELVETMGKEMEEAFASGIKAKVVAPVLAEFLEALRPR